MLFGDAKEMLFDSNDNLLGLPIAKLGMNCLLANGLFPRTVHVLLLYSAFLMLLLVYCRICLLEDMTSISKY